MEFESYEIHKIKTLAGNLGNSVFSLQNMLVKLTATIVLQIPLVTTKSYIFVSLMSDQGKKIIPFSFEAETSKPAECLYQFSQKLPSLINTDLAVNCELSCQLPLLFMLVMICSQSFSFPY